MLFSRHNNIFPISLIDKKMETRSEPDFDVSHMATAFFDDLN
jgi:hypothetical protein